MRFSRHICSLGVIWAVVIPLHARDIRVCADPDNLPFSNMKQEGFENRIAEIVAKDLDASLIYVWQRMGRGFVREYLGKGQCDLLVGIPAAYRPVLTTTPYYRSTYVFVSRRNRTSQFSSLNSSDLRGLKIGVQVLDEQYTPPGAALARRGLQDEIVGFNTIGDGAESIVRAVAEQQVDLAIVWGPLAGYFAKKYDPNLEIKPVEPEVDSTGVPFTFAISMGVSKNNVGLRDELEKVLIQKKSEIRSVLDAYGIPQLPLISAQTNERASGRPSN